jgi:hypothetical protein
MLSGNRPNCLSVPSYEFSGHSGQPGRPLVLGAELISAYMLAVVLGRIGPLFAAEE